MKESYLYEKDPGETEITWTDPETKEKKKATAAGIIKKGEDHPAYDDAKAAMDGEKPKDKGGDVFAGGDADDYMAGDDDEEGGEEEPSGEEPSGEPTTPSIGDAKETYKKTKQERDAANKEGQDAKWELQQAKEAEEKAGMFGKGKARKRVEDAEKGLEAAEKRKKVAGKAHMKAYDDYNKAQEGQGDRQKDINSGKIEPETKEEADLAAADARDSVKKQKKNRAYELQNPDPRDPTPPAEREYYWNRTVADAEKRAEEAGAKAKEFGSARTGTEEIKVINGKKYKPIKESVNKRIRVKEVYSWLKTLEEYRYRKIPGVDVRRATSFINNGLNETDLPISLQKKWGSATYSKEKGLADRFMKERINQKLTQTESKHPLKEQYDRLFTNRTVL